MNLLQFFFGLAALVVIFLAARAAYRQNRSSWTTRLYIVFCVSIVVYIVTNYLSLNPVVSSVDAQLFFIRLVMSVTFCGQTILLLALQFPWSKFRVNRTILGLLVINALFFVVVGMHPIMFSSLTYEKGLPVPRAGVGMALWAVNFLMLNILAIVVIVKKYVGAEIGDKVHYLYFLVSHITSFVLLFVATMFTVVVMRTSSMVFLGPLTWLVFITVTGYVLARWPDSVTGDARLR